MNITFEYKPLAVVEPFHRSSARERVLFGAFGLGKTFAIAAEAIVWCMEQPGIVGVVCRKTIGELRDTTEAEVIGLIPPELLAQCSMPRLGGHVDKIIFPNGSEIRFRSMDQAKKWRSMNLGFIVFDEMNEISEDEYLEVMSRVRQKFPTAMARRLGYTQGITRKGLWGATNPAGHDWIWRRFHSDSKDHKTTCEHFTGTTLDNPFLDQDFIDSMFSMPIQYIRRYVLCQFDDFSGLIYSEWDESYMIEPIKFEPDTVKNEIFWMGMDPGTSEKNPTAGLWVWLDRQRNRLVAVHEYQAPDLPVKQHTQVWRMIEAMHRMNVKLRVGDPNAVTARDRGTMMGLDEQYRKQGFNFQLGSTSEDDRIAALAMLIHDRRFVVTKDCPLTFDAIKQYQWKDLTPSQRASGEVPKDKPLKINDHLVNCAQFIAGKRMPRPTVCTPDRRDDRTIQKDEIWKSMRKRRSGKMRKRHNHDLGGMPL